MTERLASLRAMVADDPDDAFGRYALALELRKQGLLEECCREFAELSNAQPEYHMTYYHYGRVLVQLNRREDAREIYRRGIEVTRKAGEEHACEELQAALSELGAESLRDETN
jgi:tetratricopeptide (TPR) repeat protein